MKFIYLLYKTVRIETGEYYIGIHGVNTDKYPDFNDGYLGSGNRLLSSVKKYGRKAFRRSLLAISEDHKVILALEEQIVTREMVSDPLCLNVAVGGRGGVEGVSPSAKTRKKMSDAQKEISKSDETRQRMGDWQKGIPKGPLSDETRQRMSDAAKNRSVETQKKMSDAMKGKTRSAETRQKMSDWQKGIPKGPLSDETRQRMSDGMKGVPKCPRSAVHCQKISDAQKEYWRQRKQNFSSTLESFLQ